MRAGPLQATLDVVILRNLPSVAGAEPGSEVGFSFQTDDAASGSLAIVQFYDLRGGSARLLANHVFGARSETVSVTMVIRQADEARIGVLLLSSPHGPRTLHIASSKGTEAGWEPVIANATAALAAYGAFFSAQGHVEQGVDVVDGREPLLGDARSGRLSLGAGDAHDGPGLAYLCSATTAVGAARWELRLEASDRTETFGSAASGYRTGGHAYLSWQASGPQKVAYAFDATAAQEESISLLYFAVRFPGGAAPFRIEVQDSRVIGGAAPLAPGC